MSGEIREKSCGAVIFRRSGGERLYLLETMVRGHVSLCKGHTEPGETERDTARREIREETGLSVRFWEGFREVIAYAPRAGRRKTVVFFLAEAPRGEPVPQPEEVESLFWAPLPRALERLTHEADREVLRKADRFLDRDVVFESIGPDNWREGLAVTEDQRRFVSGSDRLLARAWAYREHNSQVRLIRRAGEPVGLVFWHDGAEENAWVLSQLFIDRRFQGQGLGRAGAEMALAEMRADGRFDRVILCYVEGDEPARRLYASLGFRETGEQDGNEIVMELGAPLRAEDAEERGPI